MYIDPRWFSVVYVDVTLSRQWDYNERTLYIPLSWQVRWQIDARSIPLIYWRLSICYQGNSRWFWRWYLVVIRLVTTNIYVIHWDTLSYICHHWYYNDSSAQGNDILLYVILGYKWRDIRIRRDEDQDVCEPSTLGAGCFSAYQFGKRSQETSRHSPNTNRAPHWNFYVMHRIHCVKLNFLRYIPYSCNFIGKHRNPLYRKGLSRVKQGNLLPFRCRNDEKPCKSRVYTRWYGWFLNRAYAAIWTFRKIFYIFLRFTEQIPPFFDIIYRGVILLPVEWRWSRSTRWVSMLRRREPSHFSLLFLGLHCKSETSLPDRRKPGYSIFTSMA